MNFTKQLNRNVLILVALLSLAACDEKQSDADKSTTGPTSTAKLPDALFLTTAPASPTSITQLKQSASPGDEVVVRVVVGGRVHPQVQGLAVTTVVDAAVHNKCTTGEDHCDTPWDYCCVEKAQLTPHLATVQVLDDAGKPYKVDLSTVPGFTPLNTLIVRGKVGPRPDKEVLVINATGIYVDAGK